MGCLNNALTIHLPITSSPEHHTHRSLGPEQHNRVFSFLDSIKKDICSVLLSRRPRRGKHPPCKLGGQFIPYRCFLLPFDQAAGAQGRNTVPWDFPAPVGQCLGCTWQSWCAMLTQCFPREESLSKHKQLRIQGVCR